MILIVKNNVDCDVMIEDMGIKILVDAQISLSELFDDFELFSSNDLKNLVSNNNLIINNGIDDLNIADAIEYITFN